MLIMLLVAYTVRRWVNVYVLLLHDGSPYIHVIETSIIFGEPWSYGMDRVWVVGYSGNQWSVTYGDGNDFGVLWFQEGIWSYGGDRGAKWT